MSLSSSHLCLDVLESIDGKLYIVTRYSYNTVPIIREMGWLIPGLEPESVVLGSRAINNVDGTYTVQVTTGQRSRRVRCESKASVIRETPFPCPKVRKGVEVRYKYAGWQKLHRGEWVAA